MGEVVGTNELCDWLGVSRETISELEQRGVIAKLARGRWDLKAVVLAYTAHLRERAAGRASDAAEDDGLDLTAERARLAKEQADAQAMKNAQLRGDLIAKADVVAGIQAAIAHCRAKLLSIPTKAAPVAFGAESLAVVKEKLTDLVHEALAELAATRTVALPPPAGGAADGAGGDGGDGDLGAAAEPDGERVGRPKPRAVGRGKRRAG